MSQIDQEKPSGNSGFHAQLRGASLWDLVQMECMALSHRVVKITTVDNVGYIYFSGGQIVHAETKDMAGEAAALAVLSWDEGSFEICEREWPARESIQCHWQSLVMRAAHEQDERRGTPGLSNLVAFPKADIGGNPLIAPSNMAQTGDPLIANSGIADAVRIGPDGSVLLNKTNSEEFAGTTAYVVQLVELIGAGLGMAGFQEMGCEFKTGRCLVYAETGGNYVGIRPQPNVPIQQIKQQLGI